MMGSKETTPRGNPSFVQSVTKKAITPKRSDCMGEKSINAAAKIPNATKNATASFL